jgi:hypothetical protein
LGIGALRAGYRGRREILAEMVKFGRKGTLVESDESARIWFGLVDLMLVGHYSPFDVVENLELGLSVSHTLLHLPD